MTTQPSTALVAKPQGGLVSSTWQEKTDLIRSMYKDAKPAELELFFHQAHRMGLDPLCRQIHLVVRNKTVWKGGQKTYEKAATIQVGIDGYRVVADRTGLYAGNDDPLFDEGFTQAQMLAAKKTQPQTASVTVYKVVGGLRCGFTATASWDAYAPKDEGNGFMWKKMPFLMLGKCAEALALRKAFPAELSGVYTDEEMHQAGGVVDVAPVPLEKLSPAQVAGDASSAVKLSTDVRQHYQEPAPRVIEQQLGGGKDGDAARADETTIDGPPAQPEAKQEEPKNDNVSGFLGDLARAKDKAEVDALWKAFRASNASNSDALNAGIRAKADRVRELGGAK